MKKVYLTFDIETIVSGISQNENYLAGVYLGAMFIAEELKIRDLKGTFFISMSSKQANIDQAKYMNHLKWLIRSLRSYDNIKIEPHIHAYNLPVGFECPHDQFNKYNSPQQVELLNFAKSFFSEQGVEVQSFRPGGFSRNTSYYSALYQAGYKNSSILQKDEVANIDLINKSVNDKAPYLAESGITEYPVTSVKIKSIKRKEEILNLSPDFFRIESVQDYIEKLDYININFHSFSIYLNRLIRENHDNLFSKNMKFLLFENLLNKLLKTSSLQIINTNTTVSHELLKWFDFIMLKKYNTYFIGE